MKKPRKYAMNVIFLHAAESVCLYQQVVGGAKSCMIQISNFICTIILIQWTILMRLIRSSPRSNKIWFHHTCRPMSTAKVSTSLRQHENMLMPCVIEVQEQHLDHAHLFTFVAMDTFNAAYMENESTLYKTIDIYLIQTPRTVLWCPA